MSRKLAWVWSTLLLMVLSGVLLRTARLEAPGYNFWVVLPATLSLILLIEGGLLWLLGWAWQQVKPTVVFRWRLWRWALSTSGLIALVMIVMAQAGLIPVRHEPHASALLYLALDISLAVVYAGVYWHIIAMVVWRLWILRCPEAALEQALIWATVLTAVVAWAQPYAGSLARLIFNSFGLVHLFGAALWAAWMIEARQRSRGASALSEAQ